MEGNENKQYILQIEQPDGSVYDLLWDERYDLPIEAYRNMKGITVYKA